LCHSIPKGFARRWRYGRGRRTNWQETNSLNSVFYLIAASGLVMMLLLSLARTDSGSPQRHRDRRTMENNFRALIFMLVLATAPAALAQTADPLRPAAVVTEDVPAVPAALLERLQQYQNVRAAKFEGWAPDGQGILISTRFGDTTQLHRVYVPGGRREQVTFFSESVDGRFVPAAKDGSLLVSMATGGDENYQIYYLDRGTGRSHLLTDGKSRNVLAAVRDDGKQLVINSNQRNGRDSDLYLADPRQPGSMKLLLENNGDYWLPTDWSADGARLLINRYVSINESYPALLDIASGKKTLLPSPAKGMAAYSALRFSPDGKSVFLASDALSEFQQLARLDLASSTYTWLTRDISWDVDGIAVEPTSGLVAFTTNEDGASGLYLLKGDQYRRLQLPLGEVSALAFSPDGKQLGFTFSRPDAPADAYSINIDTGKLTRWTFGETGGLGPQAFVSPESIQYKTFDGRNIPAYFYKPRPTTNGKPAPVVIYIHGGPESQYRPTFSGFTQFLVNEAGIAVLAPNVRGSAGYGKTYLQLDNAEKREDSVRDIGALLDWIARQPELDGSRVAVLGGSYGGYMVLASLTNFPDRLRAGIDIVGIASFRTFLKNTSAYRRDLRRVEYGDERDPKMLKVFEQIDPLNNTARIRSALLVAHGKNDPRVPFSEAVQIAEKVRSNGRQVWTLYADNEGHGGWRRQNRNYLDAVMVLFLERYLR